MDLTLVDFVSSFPEVTVSSLDLEDQRCSICLNAYCEPLATTVSRTPAPSGQGTEVFDTRSSQAAGSLTKPADRNPGEHPSTSPRDSSNELPQITWLLDQSLATSFSGSVTDRTGSSSKDRLTTLLGADAPPSPSKSVSPAPQEKAIRLPCGHTFGDFCFYTWLLDNSTCPICRAAIPGYPSQESRTETVCHRDLLMVLVACHDQDGQVNPRRIQQLRRTLKPAFLNETNAPGNAENRDAVYNAMCRSSAVTEEEVTQDGLSRFWRLMGIGREHQDRVVEVINQDLRQRRSMVGGGWTMVV